MFTPSKPYISSKIKAYFYFFVLHLSLINVYTFKHLKQQLLQRLILNFVLHYSQLKI
jgi:hypothetical protein